MKINSISKANNTNINKNTHEALPSFKSFIKNVHGKKVYLYIHNLSQSELFDLAETVHKIDDYELRKSCGRDGFLTIMTDIAITKTQKITLENLNRIKKAINTVKSYINNKQIILSELEKNPQQNEYEIYRLKRELKQLEDNGSIGYEVEDGCDKLGLPPNV